MRLQIGGKIRKIGIKDPVQIEICTLRVYKNELPRSRAAKHQKAFSFNPDAEHRGILLIKIFKEKFYFV